MALDLQALEVLDTIARKGSFAAAAAELGRVPSALTYTVRRLEEDLDVLLFDRRGSRAALTAAGRELLEQGRLLLRSAEALQERVQRVARGWEPELRIGVDAMVDWTRLRPLITDFLRLASPTRLRLSYEVLDGGWEALNEGRVELVIGAPHEATSPTLASAQFSLQPLAEVRFVFCMAPGHRLATLPEPLPSEALMAHTAIVLAATTHTESRRSLGLLAGQPTVTVATLEHKIDLQLAGLGVGWLPEPIARAHLQSGRLVARTTIDLRPPILLQYGWRRPASGKALQWWLKRLETPRVRKQLVAGPAG